MNMMIFPAMTIYAFQLLLSTCKCLFLQKYLLNIEYTQLTIHTVYKNETWC